MFKLFNSLKNHWKKLTVACIPVAYGLNAIKTNYEIKEYMRNVSNGLESRSTDNMKNILVVLNPAANSKKSEKMFIKYCEPFLHLAGFYVEIMKTTQIGHAKHLIESLETLPDVIVIAGGDGTASEVVTGLFRRNDTPCPIVILPLGQGHAKSMSFNNSKLEKPKSELQYVQYLHSSVMPLIENRLKTKSIFKYDLLKVNEDKPSKPIYGLRQFSWGLINDIDANKNKYWYFGSVRHYAAASFQWFSSSMINQKVYANVVYTPPCPGCSNCIITASPTTVKSKLSFSSMYNPKAIYTSTNKAPMQHINKECKMENSEQFKVNQIDIISNKNAQLFDEINLIQIKFPMDDSSFFKCIESIVKHNVNPYKIIRCRTLKMYPREGNEIDHANNSYYIDGEEYDVRPIEISLLPNALQIFC